MNTVFCTVQNNGITTKPEITIAELVAKAWDGGPKRRDSDGLKNDCYRSFFSRMEELLDKRSFNIIDTDDPE